MTRSPSPDLQSGSSRRTLLIAGAVLTLVIIAAGGAFSAYAYFTVKGSGLAQIATSQGERVTLNPATSAATLYPGSTSAVVLTITNPASSAVQISALKLDTTRGTGGFAADAAHSSCSTASLTFTQATGPWSVPANDSLLVTLAAPALAMAANADNACQGATFTLYLRAE